MKKYWKSIEEYEGKQPARKDETGEMHQDALLDLFDAGQVEKRSSRRDFLKLCGFSFTTAAIAASCERPVQKAIPYLIKPEEITPGKASYYATSYFDGQEHCPVVVKVRDGRPVKVEGNREYAWSRGGTTARVQASVLNLYDEGRYAGPLKDGKPVSWEEADRAILAGLKKSREDGKQAVLLSSTLISPSLRAAIGEWLEANPGSSWISWDPVSASGMLEANRACFGQAVIPWYDFGKASLIVSFGADFLGTWLNPAVFTRQYASGRKLRSGETRMSRHVQLEAGMSLTGSNADERIPVRPSWEPPILANLYNLLAGKAGLTAIETPDSPVDITSLAEELWQEQGRSLVISGSNEPAVQILVNAINEVLGNYGQTIVPGKAMHIRQGNDEQMARLLDDMEAGKIGALVCYQANPVYTHPRGERFREGLRSIPLVVSLAGMPDETASVAGFVCPDNHYLESWGDAEETPGSFGLSQQVISPILDTRQALESLLKWAGKDASSYDYIKKYWEQQIYPGTNTEGSFEAFWTRSVQRGLAGWPAGEPKQASFNWQALAGTSVPEASGDSGLEYQLYESVALGAGLSANNPWLQELPDPVSKIAWDNYAAIGPKTAAELGLQTGDLVLLNGSVRIPVLVQPGQATGTVSVALGYGRKICGKVGTGVGADANPLVRLAAGGTRLYTGPCELETTIETYELAMTQTHHSMEGREIVRETSLDAFREDPYSGNEKHKEVEKHHVTLYDEVHFDGHHWGLIVDLGVCTGCSSCVIACQAENNIAVVGKQEVKNRRIMHWMRIDRYYSEEPENPEVFYQPVMCQHCDNAPCENVCPVSATMHSNEGLNQVAYNRCIGTKYCINNCPYRVRRFNWFRYVKNPEFNFNQNSDLGRMVLNPDVTVRERGVVEKCSFCVQRIQEKKLEAKLENRMLKDGEIQPACVQACPAGALVFGDLNDKESKVSRLMQLERNYHLLEELHTLPSVGYLTRVRNRKENKS